MESDGLGELACLREEGLEHCEPKVFQSYQGLRKD